jgi:hypothetical protein
MKTKKLSKNLILNKETVVNLNNDEMTQVQGGGPTSKCTQLVGCDTTTCYGTGILYTCGTSIPGYC